MLAKFLRHERETWVPREESARDVKEVKEILDGKRDYALNYEPPIDVNLNEKKEQQKKRVWTIDLDTLTGHRARDILADFLSFSK